MSKVIEWMQANISDYETPEDLAQAAASALNLPNMPLQDAEEVMEEFEGALTFASEKEALQYLADFTGKRIKIAKDIMGALDEVMEDNGWKIEDHKENERTYKHDHLGELKISIRWSGEGSSWTVMLNGDSIGVGRAKTDEDALNEIITKIEKSSGVKFNEIDVPRVEVASK